MAQGYNVVGVDIETPKQENDRIRGGNFHFVQADVGKFTEAERIVQETVQRYGDRIHVLINNAAKLPNTGVSDPVKEFTDTIAVNLNGAFYLSQATLPHMPVGSSSIIHMSSTRVYQSEPNTEGYSASKAGLCRLTRFQAITLAGKVRVNAVLPGWINTDEQGETTIRPEDHSWHPVGRVEVPHDVVEMCLFLCDEKRAGFITGQEFVIDGGVYKKMVDGKALRQDVVTKVTCPLVTEAAFISPFWQLEIDFTIQFYFAQAGDQNPRQLKGEIEMP